MTNCVMSFVNAAYSPHASSSQASSSLVVVTCHFALVAITCTAFCCCVTFVILVLKFFLVFVLASCVPFLTSYTYAAYW